MPNTCSLTKEELEQNFLFCCQSYNHLRDQLFAFTRENEMIKPQSGDVNP